LADPRVVTSPFTRNSFTSRYGDCKTSTADSPAIRVKHLRAPLSRRAQTGGAILAQFALIEVLPPRGVTSDTLARFSAGFKAARAAARNPYAKTTHERPFTKGCQNELHSP
jgi:hypothetical protein